MKKFLLAVAVVLCLVTGSLIVKAQDNKVQDNKVQDQKTQDSSAQSGINGKWQFVLDTPGGDRDIDADFTVDADGKVSGTWGKDSAVGTFKDGKLELGFQMTSEEAGETSQMNVKGTLDASGAITGNWKFSSYDGSFRAIRPKK